MYVSLITYSTLPPPPLFVTKDWLNSQVNNFAPLHSSLELGRRWLGEMGAAASRAAMTIQYCMAQPRHLLASLQVLTVSQVNYMTICDTFQA